MSLTTFNPELLMPLDPVVLPTAMELPDNPLPELPMVQPVASAPVATTAAASTLQLAPPSLAGSLAPAVSPWSMLGSLLLVLGLILLLSRGLRALQGARSGSAQALQLRGSLQVGSRERVVWMQAGETHLLLGVAAGRVNNLHVFDVPPDFDQLDHKTPSTADFAHKLRQVLDRARQRAALAAAPAAVPAEAPASAAATGVAPPASAPRLQPQASPVIARVPAQPTTRFRSAA